MSDLKFIHCPHIPDDQTFHPRGATFLLEANTFLAVCSICSNAIEGQILHRIHREALVAIERRSKSDIKPLTIRSLPDKEADDARL